MLRVPRKWCCALRHKWKNPKNKVLRIFCLWATKKIFSVLLNMNSNSYTNHGESRVYHQFRRNCISSMRSIVYHHCERGYSLRLMIYTFGDEIHAKAWWYTIAFAMDKKIRQVETCRIFWRRLRDSNPRALSDKRFSRPPRYDHFDKPPRQLLSFCTLKMITFSTCL